MVALGWSVCHDWATDGVPPFGAIPFEPGALHRLRMVGSGGQRGRERERPVRQWIVCRRAERAGRKLKQ